MLLLREIKDGNPFANTFRCEKIIKSVFVIEDLKIFSAFIVHMKKKYTSKRSRAQFTKFIKETYGASTEGINYSITVKLGYTLEFHFGGFSSIVIKF